MQKDISTTKNKTVSNSDKFILSGQIVEHAYIKKNGKATNKQELYFRASIQDYYIKFCESGVSETDIKPYLNKTITVDAEIINGEWDNCSDSVQNVQSRTGNYMVIKAVK